MPLPTPISNLRYAVGGDAPSLPFHTNNLASDLDAVVCPAFPSAAVREATINTTILNALPNHGEGLQCSIVGSGKWEYDGAQWVPLGGPRLVVTYTAAAGQTAGQGANNGVTYIAGINGAASFTLRRKRMIEVHAVVTALSCDTVNTQYRLHLYDATAGDYIDARDNISATGGPGAQWFPLRSLPLPLAAGSHSISAVLQQPAGGVNGILTLGGLTVYVYDVGPA